MTALLRLLGAVWGFVLGSVADFFTWLRKPGAKLKVVCGVLAFVTSLAAVRAYDAENAVRLANLQCDLDKHLLQDSIDDRDESLAEIKANAAAERQAKNAQILRAEALRKEAEQRAKQAEASLAAFQHEYDRKPEACTAALAGLKAACPTLRDY